jgi:hypothetical protein
VIKATTCLIGATTFTEIRYVAYRPVGSGPGGTLVSPRFVANTVLPVGVTAHHLSYEVEICVDADDSAILALTSVTAPGTVLAALTVGESGILSGVAKTRTVTFNSPYFQSAQPTKIEEEAEHQSFIITVLCLAAPGFGAWS